MSLFYPMLVTGLLTGAHCVVMCGNMVLAYAIQGGEGLSRSAQMKLHGVYHVAKIVSYTAVGLLLGSIGLVVSDSARSWVAIGAGLYMVLLGLGMTGKFPILLRLQPRPPRFLITAMARLRSRSTGGRARSGKAAKPGPGSVQVPGEAVAGAWMTAGAFGLITGLMPCGPLQAAQLAAAGSGSPLGGALAMLGFGLGTVPLMLGYGAAASLLTDRFKRVLAVAGAIAIIILGGVMVDRGATALGSPYTFGALVRTVTNEVKSGSATGTSITGASSGTWQTEVDGTVHVTLVIENTRYVPDTLRVPAGKPITLTVDRREAVACSEQLVIPALGVRTVLTANGTTTITLPALSPGEYPMTCQMGMMSGVIVAVQ